MDKLKVESLVDIIYQNIKNDIISLNRPFGEKLSVSELERELDVSCTPIREAINRLQQEGLVTYKNNAGAYILTLSSHDIIEIQQLAFCLHSLAIELSMSGPSLRSVMTDELKLHLHRLKKADSSIDEVMAIRDFIGVYYRGSGNVRLDKSMLSIQGQQHILRNIYTKIPHDRQFDIDCYADMLEYTKTGNVPEIQGSLRKNVDYMTRLLVENIDSFTPPSKKNSRGKK